MPTISIIVPVHNGGKQFRRCLQSLKSISPQPEEIIVVSDGDTDGSWRLAQDFGMKVIRINTNGGPARARNLGARQAKGEILFFIDADVIVPKDAVQRVSNLFRRNPNLSAVIGSYDDQPAETGFLSQYRNLLHHYVHQTGKVEAATFWGACGAIQRETFMTAGGFDEAYHRPSIEDIELGYRLKRAGHRILLLKDLMITHQKRWDLVTMLKADFFYRALPWTQLILREGRFDNDLNLKISSRLSVVLAYLLVLTVGQMFFLPWLGFVAAGSAGGLLTLNWDIYRFFKTKRGIMFALATIPWHWFYYIYSGLAFAIGLSQFLLQFVYKKKHQLRIPDKYIE